MTELNLISQLCSQGAIPSERLPLPLAGVFKPAACWLYEWQEYWLELDAANRLRVGQTWLYPIHSTNLFRLRFENRLGLAEIQPFQRGRPLAPPLSVEVISRKFPTPEAHLVFFKALLSDLYARAARLPFTISASTSQNVAESRRPPSPLFLLHFIFRYRRELEEAINTVLGSPQRLLGDLEEQVHLSLATQIDSDVLIDLIKGSDRWLRAGGFLLAERLKGFAPQTVYQCIPEETLDTTENRFVKAFLEQVLAAAEFLPSQPWWGSLDKDRRKPVLEAGGFLRQALQHPVFAGVGRMQRLPLESCVLTRRDGYRELLTLWQLFQSARRPLFAPLQQAIDLRDVAALYEYWVFFALTEEIGAALGLSPAIHISITDSQGLNHCSEARFGLQYRLVFNQSFTRWASPFRSYSLPLRPDFVFVREGVPEVVFDAKFRLEFDPDRDGGDSILPDSSPVAEDLYKMHTYRDALSVRAAVSIYPGSRALFYDLQAGKLQPVALSDLLEDRYLSPAVLP